MRHEPGAGGAVTPFCRRDGQRLCSAPPHSHKFEAATSSGPSALPGMMRICPVSPQIAARIRERYGVAPVNDDAFDAFTLPALK